MRLSNKACSRRSFAFSLFSSNRQFKSISKSTRQNLPQLIKPPRIMQMKMEYAHREAQFILIKIAAGRRRHKMSFNWIRTHEKIIGLFLFVADSTSARTCQLPSNWKGYQTNNKERYNNHESIWTAKRILLSSSHWQTCLWPQAQPIFQFRAARVSFFRQIRVGRRDVGEGEEEGCQARY